MSDNIQVAIRLRPLNEQEIKNEKSLAWKTPDRNTIFQADNKTSDQKYVFDRVYDCEESTYDIYEETVKDIVLAGIEGFNGTIFAYGQTSSGKTYTMSGTKTQMGIIPLAVQSVFTTIDNSPSREFLLRVSYMEIYNEKITDLLDPEEKTMKMLEDENKQIVVSGLHEEVFRCCADVINLKKKGDARRRVAETARNEESSRSHAIFQIIIESQERQFSDEELVDESVRLSSLYFVDLAGSEKASENSGERFREGCAINKSLMTLAQVISKLSDGVSNQHINYRDSKLTRLLQNGLGGNSKTAIICTINSTVVDETNSTLRFASRAKIIKNKPTINELTDTSDKAILKRYQKEITDLQQQLEAFKKQTPQKTLNPYCNSYSIHKQEKAELEKKYQSVISKLKSMICVSTTSPSKKKIVRRETWCPGVLKRKLEQAGHLPALAVHTPSRILGNILEETHSPECGENVIQMKTPMIYVNSACQTERMAASENVILLKLENEMLRNQMTMISAELTDLKARPAKQRRVSFQNHDETREFLELELQLSQEKNNHTIEEEKQLEMERHKLKEERINHDEVVCAFQAEKKQLMQRVEATEGENSCLLTNLGHSQERVKNLEHELNYLQNLFPTTTNNRHSMDRPLLNLSKITDRSKRSCGDCETLKEQVFSHQSEVQMQETEIQKLTRDLDKYKEQLKNKFDEYRFLSLETTEREEKLEILQQENEKLTQSLEDKTPVSELPEVIELKTRLSEVSQEKYSLQQKLKSKSEEITYLSRESAVHWEQIESKNICSSAENGKASEEVEALKTKLTTMEAEKGQALRDLNINKLYCSNLKDQLKMKTDEYLLLQKNLNATHEEVVAMRNTLVELQEQLFAKEELILELSQIKPADVSTQQSLLFSALSPDQETIDSLQDHLNAKSKECENLTEQLQDLEGKNASKSQNDVNIGAENQTGKQDGMLVQLSNAQQEKVVLEEKYTQLMEERDGMELLVAQQAKELSAAKQSLTEREKCLEEVESEMKAQLDALRVTCKVKEEECVYLSEQLARTRQEYDDLTSTANSNEKKQVALKAEAETQSAELAKLQQQLSIAEQDHEKEVKECLELNEQVSSLTEKLLQNSEKQYQLENDLEAQSQKCSELTESLRLAQELEQNKNVDEVADGEEPNSESEIFFQTPASAADITLLDSLREELDAKREECNHLKEVADMQECEVLKQELKTLKLENENMISACSSMREQIAELKEDKKHKEELMESLRKEFEKKSQDYEILIDEMKTIQMENENKMLACTSLSEKVSTLKQEKAMSEEMLESLRGEFNAREEEFGWLKKELEDFKRNSNSKCNECKKLAEQLSILKAKTSQELATLDNKMSLMSPEEPKVNQDPALSADESKSIETTAESDTEINNKDTTHKSVDEKQVLDLLKEELSAKSEECTNLSAQLQEMTEKNMLQHLTTATQDNNEELSLCKHQLENKIEECRQLKEELANIHDDYHVLKMSLEELQDSSQLADSSLQNQLSECQAELDSKTQECTSLGKKLSEMEKDICSKTEECSTLNEKISTLEEVLSSKTKECHSLTEKLEALNAALTVKTEESSSLLQQMHSIQEADSAQQSVLNSKDDKLIEVHKELEQMHEQCSLKTSECENLSKQLSELRKNYEHIEGSLAEEMLKKASLLKELETAKSDMAMLQEEMNQQSHNSQNFFLGLPMATDDDKQALAAELETQTQKCSMLSEEMDNLKKELENLTSQKEKEARTMRCSLEELEGKSLDYDILVEEIKRSSLNPTESQYENRDLHEEIVKKTNELKEMKEENDHLASSVEQEQQNLAVVRGELAENLSELESMRQECSALKEDLSEMNSKTNGLQESLRCAQEQEQLTAKKLSAKSLECEQLTKDLSNVQKECESLKISLLSLDEENDRLSVIQKDLHATQSNLDAKINEFSVLSQHIETLNAEIEGLKVSLLNLNNENQQLLASEEKMVSLQAELDTKSQDYARLLEEVADLKNQKQDAQDLVAMKATEMLAVQNEFESKLADLSETLNTEIESLKVSLFNLNNENQQLLASEEKMVSLQAELDTKSQDYARLLEEVADLKNQKQNAQDLVAMKATEMLAAQNEFESKLADLAELKEQYTYLTKKISEVEMENVSLRESLIKLDEQNDKLSALNDCLVINKKEIVSKSEECAFLSAELEAAKTSKYAALAEVESKLESKTQECLNLTKEMSALKEQANSVEERFSQELESKCEEYTLLSNEKQNKMKMLEEMQLKLSVKTEECISLSKQVINLQKEHEDVVTCLEKKHAEKSQQCESLSTELADFLQKHSNLEKLLNSKELSELEKVKIEEQLKSLVEECGTLKEKLQAEEEKVKSLMSQLEAQNKSLEYKEDICQFLYESNTSIKTEMDQLKDQIASQNNTINNSSLQKTESSITSMNPTEELTQQLRKTQEETDSNKSVVLQEEIKAHLSKIETLSTENTKKTEIIAKLKMQDPSLTNESNESLAKLQNQLKEKTQECTHLSEQLKNVQADLMETKAQLKKKLEKADLCELYEKENKEQELKLKELEEEKMETTMRLTKVEAELERKSEISMMSMNPTEDLTELTQQLKKALEEKDSHKSVFLYESNTSIKTEMDQLKDQIASQNNTINNSSLQKTESSITSMNPTEELTQQLRKTQEETDSNKSVVLQEEIKAHLSKIETLSTENTKKTEIIAKLKMQDPSLTNESNESLAKLQNQLKEKTQECTHLSEQLKNVQADLMETKAQLKKKLEKADLCELYEKENKEQELKLKELEEEKMETTMRLTKVEAELERKSEISMMSMNPTEDLTELTQQLKKALEEKDSHKSVAKKLKIEIIQLKDKLEDLEGKADLCQLYEKENKEQELKLKELEEEKMETTMRLTKVEAELERKSEIGMMSMNPTEDLTELTQQLKKALEEKDSHKSVAKKLKIEIIQLKDKLEDLEGKADLCQLYEKENKEQELKLKELEEEKMETTMRLTKVEAELERKSEISMMSMNPTEDLTELTQQLKKALEEKDSHKSVAKKLKIEIIQLKDKLEDLEGKADLCQLYEKENKEQELKLKELEEEKMETTMRLTKVEAELERKSEIGMMSMNPTEDLTELTQQLKKALEEKDSHKSVTKKLKIEKIELKETLEDLEGKANLCEVLQEEIKNHLEKIDSLSSENTKKDDTITKLKIDVREKQECIHMLETRTFCDLKAQELESLQRQLSKKSMHLVWAQSDYKVEKAQFEKKMKSYEETIDILTEKIKHLKEELRLLQAEKEEITVKVPHLERKRTRSAQPENVAIQSQGFIDHMAFITLEAENTKMNRKIESLKQKLSNSLKNHEELKKELQTFKETAEKENTPSKRKKVAEKSTNTEILKLADSNTPTPGKLTNKNSPSRLKPQQRVQPSTEKDECKNQ